MRLRSLHQLCFSVILLCLVLIREASIENFDRDRFLFLQENYAIKIMMASSKIEQ